MKRCGLQRGSFRTADVGLRGTALVTASHERIPFTSKGGKMRRSPLAKRIALISEAGSLPHVGVQYTVHNRQAIVSKEGSSTVAFGLSQASPFDALPGAGLRLLIRS